MKKTFYFGRKMLTGALMLLLSAAVVAQITDLPVIDGDGSEASWDQAVAWPLEAVIDVTTVDDAADLSGDVKVLWSADSFYVKVEVLDDLLFGDDPTAYRNDNVCIYLDVYNKATGSYIDSTQMYWEKNWYQAADQMGGRVGPDWTAPPGNFAVDTADGMTGYTIELAVAWSEWDFTPAADLVLGFDVKLSDNDGDTFEDQTNYRNQITWRDVKDMGWTEPRVFGEITAVADGSFTGKLDFFPPVIDGMGTTERAWTTAPAWSLDAVIDDATVSGAADLSGTTQVMWSADSFYVKVEVQDDLLFSAGGDAYLYDNACIYLDVYNKATRSYIDSTQMYWEKNWWQEATQMGGRVGPDWAAPPGNFAVDTMDGMTGYTIELAVAWDEWSFTPAEGSVLGFDVKLSDNDGETLGDQTNYRNQISWRDVTDRGYTDPLVFGEITMEEDNIFSGVNMFDVEIDGMMEGERAWALTPEFNIETVLNEEGLSGTPVEASFKVAWDMDNLYAMVDIADDTLYGLADPWYENDVVNIFYDLLAKGDDYADTTSFYYEQAMYDVDQTGGRFGPDWTSPPGNLVFTVTEGVGYVVEVATAWTDILSGPLAEGDVIGFDVKVVDNDGDARDQITWNMDSDNGYQWTTIFGHLKLEPAGAVSEYAGIGEVANLTATVDGASVTLTWDALEGATAYNVYRGEDLIGDGIAEVTLTDADLDNGSYTYKVTTIDVLGIESAGVTADAEVAVGISNTIADLTQVYPNPANDNLFIESPETIESVRLIRVSGQVVDQVIVNNTFGNIDLSEVKPGLYILSVQFEKSVGNYRVVVK